VTGPRATVTVRVADGEHLDVAQHARRAAVRRRVVVGATLVLGTGVLAATLAATPGSGAFYGLGLLAAVTWIAGALLSGPIPAWRAGAGGVSPTEVVGPLLLGAGLFLVFLAARVVAGQVAVLDHAVGDILATADGGRTGLVLGVALVNGLGEELFFRGALHAALPPRHRAIGTTIVYCLVTVATRNTALVVAAAVMGTVFVVERRATRSVVAPVLTHMSWGALVLLLLPR
jgi:membrane protease YdiL (CAAX protease family)